MRKIYIIQGASSYTLGVRVDGGFRFVDFAKAYGYMGCRVKIDDEATQKAIESHNMFISGSIIAYEVTPPEAEVLQEEVIEQTTEIEDAEQPENGTPVTSLESQVPGTSDPSHFTKLVEVKEYLNKEHEVSYSRLQNVEAVKSVIKEKGLFFPNVNSLK